MKNKKQVGLEYRTAFRTEILQYKNMVKESATLLMEKRKITKDEN